MLTEPEFWKGVDGAYKRLGYLAIVMASVSAIFVFF